MECLLCPTTTRNNNIVIVGGNDRREMWKMETALMSCSVLLHSDGVSLLIIVEDESIIGLHNRWERGYMMLPVSTVMSSRG